jgi:hypothetical protein
MFSAYLSGFRRPQVLSDAPKKRSGGESLGRANLTCCPQGLQPYSPALYASVRAQIVRYVVNGAYAWLYFVAPRELRRI